MKFSNNLTHTIKTIRQRYNNHEQLEYEFFYSNREIYSNWYPAKFTVQKHEYANTEQYMMAEKANLFQDSKIHSLILKEKNPAECKKLGRLVAGFNESKWQNCRCKIMVTGCYAKFSQNPRLKEVLLATGNKILVEASPYDDIWGIKMSKDAKGIENPNYWKGLNLLGFCLMEVRELLKNEES